MDRLDREYQNRLAERFRLGDATALDTLFEMHVDRVYGFARHLLGNREDAEEVVSEAFIRVFEKIREYRGDRGFHSWLYAIVRNLCRDRLRQPRLFLVEWTDEVVTEMDSCQRQGSSSRIADALAQVSEDHRDVLILCDLEEWDIREAAEFLERTPEATKSLLYRARKSLKAQLMNELQGEDQ